MQRWIPLTAAGLVIAVLGVAAYVAGWQLGWIELMVVAAACLVALVFAIPFVVGRMRLEVSHTVMPQRVAARGPVVPQAVVTVRNRGAATSRRRTVVEQISGLPPESFSVDPIPPGGTHDESFDLPNDRRAKLVIGPAVIARHDPLFLMHRAVVHARHQTCWIHPRYEFLPPLSAGFAKDLEGPTSDSSPAGDIAFHTLREYADGDDFRHIHWLSTARSTDQSLIVRHYVDNRRPQVLVLVDDRSDAMSGDQFEVAIEIVASLVVSAMAHREPISVWDLGGPLLGADLPGTEDDALDRLTEAVQRDGGDPLQAGLTALRSERGTSALIWVTGALDPDALAPIASQLRRRARPIIVRVWPTGHSEAVRIRGCRVIDVRDLDEFALAWRGVV